MDSIGISRNQAIYGLVIFGAGGLGLVGLLLPDLLDGTVPLRSFHGVLNILGLLVGCGLCLTVAVSQARQLLDRRPGLAIVGDRLDIHPFWSTVPSLRLADIARISYEPYKYMMDVDLYRRHRLRVDLRSGLGDGEPVYFETWRMAGGDAAGKTFGAEIARRAGLALETVTA